MWIVFSVLFGIVTLLGMYLLTYVLRSKNPPKAIAFTHGPLAALGILILLIYTIHEGSGYLIVSLVLLCLAALGGFFLIYRDLTQQSIPKPIAIGHGITALIGLFFILLHFLKHSV